MNSAELLRVPHRVLEPKSLKLCTLWDMISTPAYKIVNHAFGMQHLHDTLKHRYSDYLQSRRDDTSMVRYSVDDRASIEEMNANMRPWLEAHGLKESVKRLNEVVGYASSADCHIDDLAGLIGSLMMQVESELEDIPVFSIHSDDAKLYAHPEEWFPETLISFPSATLDVQEACKCYALERYTACVYHCMAVLQVGLYALARDVGIGLKFPIEFAEWGEILREIEKKVEPHASLPRSEPLRQRYDHLYSGAISQFRYLKDGWRNHVAHMREVYDQDKARTALAHVRDFMESISTRLHE